MTKRHKRKINLWEGLWEYTKNQVVDLLRIIGLIVLIFYLIISLFVGMYQVLVFIVVSIF
jgi:hypothetical protein